jgi:hypothetical protein
MINITGTQKPYVSKYTLSYIAQLGLGMVIRMILVHPPSLINKILRRFLFTKRRNSMRLHPTRKTLYRMNTFKKRAASIFFLLVL